MRVSGAEPMRGRNVMTPDELRDYCERTGQAMPSLAPKKKGPHAKLALDLGDTVITVECPPPARMKWRDWLNGYRDNHGGRVVEW